MEIFLCCYISCLFHYTRGKCQISSRLEWKYNRVKQGFYTCIFRTEWLVDLKCSSTPTRKGRLAKQNSKPDGSQNKSHTSPTPLKKPTQPLNLNFKWRFIVNKTGWPCYSGTLWVQLWEDIQKIFTSSPVWLRCDIWPLIS